MTLLNKLKNKYLIATVLFLVWTLFFDQNDYFTQKERSNELEETKANIQFLRADIAKMEHDYIALQNDPRALEKYAREKYRMKRDDEDVYIFDK